MAKSEAIANGAEDAAAEEKKDKKKGKEKIRAKATGLFKLAHKNTSVYMGMMSLFAAAGIGYVLLFPLMVLFSVYGIYAQIVGARDWISIVINLVLIGLCGFITFRLTRVKVAEPVGVKTGRDAAPKLYELIDELQSEYRAFKIDAVILTERPEISIIKTPVFGLPVWYRTTLAIGVPKMSALSPDHFRVILSRTLGQYSKKRNLLSNWIHQTRQVLSDYNQALRDMDGVDYTILSAFYAALMPVFDKLWVFGQQVEDLNADRYAQDCNNHEDMVQALEAEYAAMYFLDNYYWPKVRQMVENNPSATPVGCARIAPTIQNNLPKMNLKKWIEDALKVASVHSEPHATLRQRMEELGHEKVVPFKPPRELAIQALFGESYYRVLKVVDMLWTRTVADPWRREAEIRRKDMAMIQQLKKKGTEAKLTGKEMRQYLELNRKHDQEPTKLPWWRFLTGKLPKS